MSFHTDLLAVWPAHLVASGIVASAGNIHTGRRRRNVTDSAGELWIERLPNPLSEGRGFQGLIRHAYMVHVTSGIANKGANASGQEQLEYVEAKLEALVGLYHGQRPFTGSLTSLVSIEASEDNVDVDEEQLFAEGTVRVVFTVAGSAVKSAAAS